MADKSFTSSEVGGVFLNKASSPLAIPKGVRHMTYYTVYDTELDRLAEQGWITTFFYSLAMSCFVFTAGMKWDVWFSDAPAKKVEAEAVVTLLWITASVFAALGTFFAIRRGCLCRKIRKQHVHSAMVESGH